MKSDPVKETDQDLFKIIHISG